MTIIETLRGYLSSYPKNKTFSRIELVKDVAQKYSMNETSIIPSDYCYNITNASFMGDKYLSQPHFFVSKGNGKYQYIGEQADYTGEITNSQNKTVGYWEVGVCEMLSDKEAVIGNPYENYWQKAYPKICEKLGMECIQKIRNRYYMNWASGVSGVVYEATFSKEVAWVGLYINDDKALFDRLKLKKHIIESQIGAELKWDRIDAKKACRIYLSMDGVDITNPNDWSKVEDFHVEMLNKLYNAMQGAIGLQDITIKINATWLLTWNRDNWPWGEYAQDAEKVKAGEPYTIDWTCSNTNVKIGDRVFLIKLGSAPKGIVASGYALSENFEAPHWDKNKASEGKLSKRIIVKFDIVLDYEKENILPSDELQQLFPKQQWSPMGSGITIQEEYINELEKIWNQYSTRGYKMKERKLSHSRNMILYGPPGTGKTYNTILYAVAICDGFNIPELEKKLKEDPNYYSVLLARYNKLKAEKRVIFTTFHQSYGYEEFIEGIRPVISKQDEIEEASDVKYEYSDGVFKVFCKKAQEVKIKSESAIIGENPTIWNVLLDGAGISELKKKCFENNYIKIGWRTFDEIITDQTEGLNDKARRILLNFQDEMKVGDIILTQKSNTSIDGIGIVTGAYEYTKDNPFPRTRQVHWIATNIDEDVYAINKNVHLDRKSTYPLKKMDVKEVVKLIEKYSVNYDIEVEENDKPYVFIIDEINRGNISKIFGELITLIETTKRLGAEEAATAILPYTKEEFGVPDNVYILGTMNTADRSIAIMDTALRRRFNFVEMMPDSSVLCDIPEIEGISVVAMLDAINTRIEYLYDREHTIGHAYFTSLKKEPTLDKLSMVFKNAIIPLLQEYFYEDYAKIQMVLADTIKPDENKMILNRKLDPKKIFKTAVDIDLPEAKYSIQESAFTKADSYILIY